MRRHKVDCREKVKRAWTKKGGGGSQSERVSEGRGQGATLLRAERKKESSVAKGEPDAGMENKERRKSPLGPRGSLGRNTIKE